MKTQERVVEWYINTSASFPANEEERWRSRIEACSHVALTDAGKTRGVCADCGATIIGGLELTK